MEQMENGTRIIKALLSEHYPYVGSVLNGYRLPKTTKQARKNWKMKQNGK